MWRDETAGAAGAAGYDARMMKAMAILGVVLGAVFSAGCTQGSYNATNIAVTPYIYKEQLEGREVYRMTMQRSTVWVDPVGARIIAFSRSNRAQMTAKREGDDLVFVENKMVSLYDYQRFDEGETIMLSPEAPELGKAKFWLSYTNIGQMTFVSQKKDGWVLTRDFRLMDNGALYVISSLQNRELSGREVTINIGVGKVDTAMLIDGRPVGLTVAKKGDVLMRFLVPNPKEEDFMQWNAGTESGVNSMADKDVRFTDEQIEKMKIVVGDEALKYAGFVIGPIPIPVTGQHKWTEKWVVKQETDAGQ